ncbi:unnamed protein product [Parnassius apollo]|uniref:(apollo) hypothetical protein n=1 Tax=Parnassius apollo TaxID=110799 RepID=A0A8S3W462_PARAO|nr:unnamed protein product [Parnassius apollo]
MAAARLPDVGDATAVVVQPVSQQPQPYSYCTCKRLLRVRNARWGKKNLSKMFGPTIVGYGMMTQAAEMYSATAKMCNVTQLLLRLPGGCSAQFPRPRWCRPASPGGSSSRQLTL